jgi:hypothetical protein
MAWDSSLGGLQAMLALNLVASSQARYWRKAGPPAARESSAVKRSRSEQCDRTEHIVGLGQNS